MMTESRNEKRLVLRLLGVVVGMFAFGFALVPLYDVFCEITGANGKTAGKFTVTQAQEIDEQRLVTIQFLTSNNGDMPWEFRPKKRMLKIHPGELNSTSFYVRNPANKTMVAQAVPSVSPFHAAQYLHKTECFCFDQQQLAQGEEMDMPLRFIIDADLPKDVNTLTLSYTLFDVTDQFYTALDESLEDVPKENRRSNPLAVNLAGFD
jgi:cytochrome c oxidase assembly protein subunit 11